MNLPKLAVTASFTILLGGALVACTTTEGIHLDAGHVVTTGSGGSGGGVTAGAGGGAVTGVGGTGGDAAGGAGGQAGAGGATDMDGGADVSDDGGGSDVGSDAGDNDGGDDGGADGGGADGGPCVAGGYALSFNQSTYGTIARNVQDDFTIEAWIKTSVTSLTGNAFWQGNGLIYSDVAGLADDFGTSILNDQIVFGVSDGNLIASTTSVTTGEWIHFAVTRNRTTGEMTLLINGVQEANLTATDLNSLIAQPNVTFGGNTIDGHYFGGLMDEVRFWNVVRSASDIQSTMHKPLQGNEPGLVGYWKFDEATGASAADSSQSGDNATLGDGLGNAVPDHVVSDAPLCGP